MRFNISRFKSEARCPRYYGFRHVDTILGGPGFVKYREAAPAAAFGTACHESLRIQYEKGMGALDEAIAVGRQYLLTAGEEADDPDDRARILHGTGGGERACTACSGTGKLTCKSCDKGLTLKSRKPHKICEGAGWNVHKVCNGTGRFTPSGVEGIDYHEKMMRAHALEYPTDVWDKVLLVEQELEYDLGNGHSLVGKLDLVAQWNGGLWDLDHKTCYPSTNFGQEILRYEIDWQRHGYWLLILQKFGELPKGSWMNLLRKTYEPSFFRAPVAYDQRLVDDSLKFFRDKTTELAKLHASGDISSLHRRATSCISFNRPCTYLPICSYKIPYDDEQLKLAGYVAREKDYTETWDEHKEESDA